MRYLYDLSKVLIAREIKLRYRRSILGIAWSLVTPLVQLGVFTFLFRSVLPLGINNYSSFLFTGLLAWNWFQTALISGTGVIVDNRDLVRRPGFPIGVLPFVTVTTNWIHFVLALPILLAFLLLNQVNLSPYLLLLPVLFAVQFLFTVGLIYFLAALHVTFRDTQYMLGIVLMLGFYLTPVIYEFSAVPERFRMLYQINPMAVLIGAYRAILLEARPPSMLPLILLALAAAVLAWFGAYVYLRGGARYAEEL